MDPDPSSRVRWSGGNVEVLDDDDQVIDTFTDDEISVVSNEVLGTQPPVQSYVMFSRDDGQTWSATSLEELIGRPGGVVDRLTVTANGVTVQASVAENALTTAPFDQPVTTDGSVRPLARTTYVVVGRLP
jgi:hypothetical protein